MINSSSAVPIILLGLLLLPVTTVVFPISDNPVQKTEFIPSEYIEHSPIDIESNADFVNQGWPGNGTKEEPFVIEGWYIANQGHCIEISDTTAHVIIKQCNFSTGVEINDAMAIYLENATNIRIENNLFFSFHAIRLRYTTGCVIWNNTMCRRGGVFIQASNDSVIEKNTFSTFNQDPNCAAGVIDISYSNNFTIRQNTISNCGMAIHSYNSNDVEVIENTIFMNEDEGMIFNSISQLLIFNNTISSNQDTGIALWHIRNSIVFSNRIGGNIPNAFEYGGENSHWDNGVSIGNFWDDYDGTGVYEIAGVAGAIDNYPTLWDIDLWGPEIVLEDTSFPDNNQYTITLGLGYTFGYMDHYFISVEVTDISGVDCVQIVMQPLSPYDSNWYSYSMTHDPLPEHPDRYTYNVTFQDHLHELIFYILANDTMGNIEKSPSFKLGDRLVVKISSDPTNLTSATDSASEIAFFLTNPFVFSLLFASVIATAALYRYKKLK